MPPMMLPPRPGMKKSEDSREGKEPGARLRRVGQQILDGGRYPRSSSVNR